MLPKLVLTLATAVGSPLPSIQITDDLTIEAQYLEVNQRAPYEGLLVRLEDFAQLKTEIVQAEATCSARIDALSASHQTQILAMQEDFQKRTAGYVARIDELGNKFRNEQEQHAQTRESYKYYRWTSYGIGAAIMTTTGIMFWSIAK